MCVIEFIREAEFDCNESLALVAEVAEAEMQDRPIAAERDAVRNHLAFCADCREEYVTLLKVLDEFEAD